MERKCTRCSETPNTKLFNQTVYIGFGSDHIIDKMKSILQDFNYVYQQDGKYLKINVKNLETLIVNLSDNQQLSSIEKKDVFILPVPCGEEARFDEFFEVKSLVYWMTFYNNLDIIMAIQAHRIKALFQPIYDIKTNEIYGHEILSRAYDDAGESIGAERLFSASKKLDLLFNLDRQCRINCIESASKFTAMKGKLFINFIPTVIYDPAVCLSTTHAIVEKTGINPSDIVFEVVESEYIEDYDHLSTILEHYREKGYMTALDDLGSGYQTLSKFNLLRTDYIKIDRELIENIHDRPASQSYLDQVLALKERTGVKIIAEGVETKEEYDYVKAKGVDLVQGYYLSKPASEPIVHKK